MSFKAYEEYKDSGVKWLGEVPAQWDSKRLKFLFDICKRPIRDQDEIITCFRDGTVTLRSKKRADGFTNAVKEIGYQGVRNGDLVIHAMDAFAGAIGVSDSDGKSTPVYSVCRPRDKEYTPYYYARLLRHMALSGFVTSLAKGIRERSTDFRWADASEIFLPVPSMGEQENITAFLNHETARIDALIEEQQRLIALLKEKRQAVISHAVTKGLDPNVPMKDSGVEWLGEVPAHWDVKPLRRHTISGLSNGLFKKKHEFGSGAPLINVKDAYSSDYYVKEDALDRVTCSESELTSFRAEKDDVFIVRSSLKREGIASAVILGSEIESCVFECHLIKVRFSAERINPRFATLVLNSKLHHENLIEASNTTTMTTISQKPILAIPMPTPSLEEQISIVETVDSDVAQIDQLISESLALSNLLLDRRSALISAAVTGKIDVRGWTPPADAVPAQQAARTEAV
ncbi:restriction endonuclease subunit S [Cobetia sp. AM6]|uniref:restriction endonuclease subunit S n=1 Tax=Cobetia sp. AM6 TaxID=2661553 RepID=UPI001298FE89|nr:restriction endonuclease subunit S [Cobetia sp. AM6]BBO55935.1 restriction modification system DNA specificity domain-containing protein [Cobetia sp. AM6]